MDNLEYLKKSVVIFLDQNMKCNNKDFLEKKGYQVKTVFCIGYIGANDGKLLKVLQRNNWILVTHDKKFFKMATKYNVYSILIKKQNWLTKRVYQEVQNSLIHDYKKLAEKLKQ